MHMLLKLHVRFIFTRQLSFFPALDPYDLTESGLDIYPSAGFGTGKFQWKEEAMAWRYFCTNGIKVPLHTTYNFQKLVYSM